MPQIALVLLLLQLVTAQRAMALDPTVGTCCAVASGATGTCTAPCLPGVVGISVAAVPGAMMAESLNQCIFPSMSGPTVAMQICRATNPAPQPQPAPQPPSPEQIEDTKIRSCMADVTDTDGGGPYGGSFWSLMNNRCGKVKPPFKSWIEAGQTESNMILNVGPRHCGSNQERKEKMAVRCRTAQPPGSVAPCQCSNKPGNAESSVEITYYCGVQVRKTGRVIVGDNGERKEEWDISCTWNSNLAWTFPFQDFIKNNCETTGSSRSCQNFIPQGPSIGPSPHAPYSMDTGIQGADMDSTDSPSIAVPNPATGLP